MKIREALKSLIDYKMEKCHKLWQNLQIAPQLVGQFEDLSCYVMIEVKIGEFDFQDIGQFIGIYYLNH